MQPKIPLSNKDLDGLTLTALMDLRKRIDAQIEKRKTSGKRRALKEIAHV